MEGLPQNKPQVRYNEQGFIIQEEATALDEEGFSEEEMIPNSAPESENTEEVEPTKEVLPNESLAVVAESAKRLEVLMKERASRALSKQFMSPAQAEAFSHVFEMATESIKCGDVEGFKQEMVNLGHCFEGYGVDQGGAVREDVKSLEGVGREFASLRRNFDTACTELKNIEGIDTTQLSKVQTHFAKIDDFHSRLYQAARRYSQN